MANFLIIFIIFIEIYTFQNYVIININNKDERTFNKNLQKSKNNNHKMNKRIKKAVRKNKNFLWTFPIKYHIKKKKLDNNVIDEAIQLIEKETCIKFEKSSHRLKQGSGITFRFSRKKCSSYVGKKSNRKPQSIFLTERCKRRVGSVLHEIGHALGMYHEISRRDRDKYVKILFENMQKKSYHNFRLAPANDSQTFGISYDLGSVMHYYLQVFAIRWDKITVLPLDKNYKGTIGQRVGYTFNDIKSLNYLYCNQTCFNSTTPLKCHNYGYPDPRNCSQCKCPVGFAGINCTILKPQSNEEKCKPYYFNATSTESTLNKTGIMNCTFLIKSKNSKVVNVTVTNVNASPAPNRSDFLYCFSGMALEIKHKKDTSVTGLCLCGEIKKPINITSEGDEVFVMWYGKEDNHTFTLKYKEVDPPSDKST